MVGWLLFGSKSLTDKKNGEMRFKEMKYLESMKHVTLSPPSALFPRSSPASSDPSIVVSNFLHACVRCQ